MARDHARILTSRHNDRDWRTLPMCSQWLFDYLLTSPTLTYAGVATYNPKRIAKAINDGGVERIDVAAYRLETFDPPYVVIDRETDEAFIRSFVRNDGLLKSPKVAIAAFRAWESITSDVIRACFVFELARLRDDRPDLASWEHEMSGQFMDSILSDDAMPPTDAYTSLTPNPAAHLFTETLSETPPETLSETPRRRGRR